MWIRFVTFFFFKQKTAYEMVRSDWSSDVCSSDLPRRSSFGDGTGPLFGERVGNAGVPKRATDTKRNELPRRVLDELRHHGVARNVREMVPEAAAVGVRRQA